MNRFLISILIVSFSLQSCSKKDKPNTINYVTAQLTGNSNRTWHLKGLYLNGQSQTLTTAQSNYTKTYNSDGTWLDSDGYKGTFSLLSITSLKEITTNAVSGSSTMQYDILTISGTNLIVEYTFNMVKYRFEFIP